MFENRYPFHIKVDRIEVCTVDQDSLPNDAALKGYESVIIQELHIKTENVVTARAYVTTPRKDRRTVLDLLRGEPDGKARSYCFNEEFLDLLDVFGLSAKLIFQLRAQVYGDTLDEAQMQQMLGVIFPD